VNGSKLVLFQIKSSGYFAVGILIDSFGLIAFAKVSIWRWSVLVFALALFAIPGVRSASGAEALITNCLDVLQLPAERRNIPARLRGVVTCYQPSSQLCFVQDETAGIYVFPQVWSKEFSFGEIVEVQGLTGTGRFSPIIQSASIQTTGQRAKLAPKPVAVEDLNTGRFDSQWVQVGGVVQSFDFGSGVCNIELWNGCTMLKVLAFGFEKSPTNLVDATVRIEGVGGTFYDANRLTGFGLFSQNPALIRVAAPAPDPFETPLRSARSLPYFSKEGGLDHRVRIKGVAAVAWPGEAIFIHDDSGPIRVETGSHPGESINPGDLVEAAGFIRDLTETPYLVQAVIRKMATKAVPDPIFLKPKELTAVKAVGQYVTTSGVLFGTRNSEAGYALMDLQSDNRIVTAVCRREDLADFIPGSLIRVSGAWSSPPWKLREQLGPVLWLNSRAALAVLAPPKNETISGLTLKSFAGICVGGFVLGGVVLIRERQRAGRLAALESSTNQRLADAEREMHRLSEDRERLGRDLHDRIIQSIYGIGLNLDHCAQTAPTEPNKIQTRLRAALKDVNGVISELRNVIVGLETNAIQPREFRTALKSLSLALGHEESKGRIRLVMDDEAVAALTPRQATELVHIAREAMSNSIRHGGALTNTFRLELRDETILFAVEDDGHGFNPNGPPGTGFGLRNMSKRAESLGAKFSILSEEGQGTRVTLDIPRQKTHFSIHEPRTGIDR
jgi:signal transduction histidine kinase